MKKIFKLSALFCAAALTIVSCTKELQTAQFDEENVTLASFGPNPAMRGSTVSFYGSNLDKITEVNVPGMEPITGSDIEVVAKGKVSQIRVVLDREAPEVGYITLKTSDGKEFKTKSELTYKEPIVFDGFVANEITFPGETITLKGTYMDQIQTVTFAGGEKVDVLEGATRHEAKVVVPANAVTGVIILSDGAEIESLFYSENELVMGEPTVKANAKTALKAGAKITFTGAHLEMIQKIAFDGAEVEKFDLAEDNSSISLVLPAEAKAGAFNAVSFAGKSYKAGEFTAVSPAVAAVSPTAVKAGNKLTIKGSNLDLVTKVAFDGEANATFEATASEIVVDVTAKVKEGEVTLTTANGTEVKTAFKLVHPTITKVAPEELFAGDEPVVVTGKDLDLVVSATIAGRAVEISEASATSLTLATQVTNVSGKVALTLANGEVIESASEVVMKYHSKVIVTSRPSAQHIGQIVTLKGTNMDLVESVYVGDEKVTKYSLRSAEELSFLMPWNKAGSYPIKFVLYDGDVEVQAENIEVLLEQNIVVLWEGEAVADDWGNQPFLLSDAGLELAAAGAQAGTTVRFYLSPLSADWKIQIVEGHWGPTYCSYCSIGNDTEDGKFTECDLDGVGGFIELTLTQAMLDAALTQGYWGGTFLANGDNIKVTKIVAMTDISQEVDLWEGEAVADDWGNQPFLLSDAGLELAAAGAKAGQEVHFYLTPLSADWKIQIVEGHWGATYCSYCSIGNDTEDGKFTEWDLAANGGYISITLTEEILTAALTQGYWGGTFLANGDNVKVTKITLL